MKNLIVSLLSLLIISTATAEDSSTFISKLRVELTSAHHPITYQMANDILFTKLDNHNGSICSVYSPNNCLVTAVVPSPKLMNIEHTWPQSEGANGDAKSDLHHIFVTDSPTNSIRSSLPFCDVELVKWTNSYSKRGMSKFNEHCFEPPKDHKGDVARAIFYFAVRYNKNIDEHQEYFLRLWDKLDPISPDEIQRNIEIQKFQGNLNPFITNPELVNQISDF